MPPQPGMFALPYASTTHTARADVIQSSDNLALGVAYQHQSHSQSHHHRHHHHHHHTATRPETHPLYLLRLYPISLERSALLGQIASEEEHALRGVKIAWSEERERVEDEWKRGRDRIRERLMEGIEERRRRAREEKEGEGTGGDSTLDSQTRQHITRKLRNKYSPPPTPGSVTPGLGLGLALGGSSTPITTNANPLSLSIDELPSPFPLPLTSVLPSSSHSSRVPPNTAGGASVVNTSRRRTKPTGAGLHHSMSGTGGLGKSLASLAGGKEGEIESDLGEIRRASKRKRGAALGGANIS